LQHASTDSTESAAKQRRLVLPIRPPTGILFNFDEYLALVDWTGRIIRSDKRRYIDNALPPILTRLQISQQQWRINTTEFEAIHPGRFNRQAPQLDTG
jgi:hypothetical protein